MGSTSSRRDPEMCSLRDDEFPWELLGSMVEEEDKETDHLIQPILEGAVERARRELHALFPSKLGNSSSTDVPKEGCTEKEDDELIARFSQFMKGGACKEVYTAFEDCFEKTDNIYKCPAKYSPLLIKCVDAHSEYYQPIIALAECTVEQFTKEVKALELAPTKQPERLNTTSPLLRWRNMLLNGSRGRSKPRDN
ncbi:PREDICTED: uncharacterized protein LOC104735263 [Camelina sativa]|uniref:Uncharacterized protein LOC104735263 n=1 Tax=Camelina sativa TaxID=90675 RepID=A0ABM0VAF3_CAMSA|nr:PREDICTED: uncharacterized protein LOC104735263 [Camelina sativa]